MSKKDVLIYISNKSKTNSKLLKQMDEWNIDYKTKNVTDHPEYMVELQEKGIFGTPVTFINGDPILGFQKNKIKNALGMNERFYNG